MTMNDPASNNELQNVFDRLVARMRKQGDFPALSGTITRIQNISSSENESLASLTNEILKDVALTNKLLRLVNTVDYARGNSIRTVSRAVSLVGFNGIRNLTLSLVLLEHMPDKAHAALLKEEFLRALMAASIAREMAGGRSDGEEAFIGAMFQNLGRLLVEYYFPQEAQAVRHLMAGDKPKTEAAAAIEALGISFEQLGLGMAKVWSLPDIIQRCIRKPAGPPPTITPSSDDERALWIALAANEAADQILLSNPKEAAGKLAAISIRYARSIGLNSRDADKAILRAREKLLELAKVLDLKVAPSSMAAKLLQVPASAGESAVQERGKNTDSAYELDESSGSRSDAGGQEALPENRQTTDMLLAGVHDVVNAMVEDFKLSDVLRMILETMYRAMAFDHIVFCMRDVKTNTLHGRFGLGHGVENIVKSFKIPLNEPGGDLFSAVCIKGADTLISDARDVRFADRLPDWYRTTVNAPTFLLLPLSLKGSPFGLIYADKKGQDKLQLSENELSLLRTLRSQAVMAFRQSS